MLNDTVYKNYDEGRAEVFRTIHELLRKGVSTDYVCNIADDIFEDVVEDVFTASAVDETHDCLDFNEDDVKLAIGRILIEHLGIQS